jgi:hypothetical protein
MKRPAFQFYPADWRKDANLRRCSPAARGVWMDVLCVLHDAEPYGVVNWPLKELASAAGAALAHVRELVGKRVLKGCDQGECEPLIYTPRHGRKLGDPVTLITPQAGPIWYSARFVRDEYVRTIRGESTRFGDTNGDAPKAAPMPPIGDGSSSSSSPSGSVANATDGKPADDSPKAELWRAAVSVLEQGGCPKAQCRTFMGKLVGDYTFPVVQQAVAAAVTAQPADAREYLKATCQRLKGERVDPITVPSDAHEKTAAYLAEVDKAKAEMKPPPADLRDRFRPRPKQAAA